MSCQLSSVSDGDHMMCSHFGPLLGLRGQCHKIFVLFVGWYLVGKKSCFFGFGRVLFLVSG